MGQIEISQGVAIATLIAATLPLVASVFAAFHPSTRVGGTADYFLFSGKVDVDSFLKASIGYSLQVAAIYLFFSWAISYGAWTFIVAIAWSLGFFLVAEALKRGYFDGFLKETKEKPITIHGFISEQLNTKEVRLRRACVLVVSLATIIGLGGTMITEIDYTTKILLRATGLLGPTNPNSEVFNFQSGIVHLTILLFVLLYVLWGGYKAVLVTERFQVPAAYVAFLLFGIGVIYSTINPSGSSTGSLLLGSMSFILVAILAARWYLLRQLDDKKDPTAAAAKASAWLTFLPLLLLSFAIFSFSLTREAGQFSFGVLLPATAAPAGFGIIGAFSLFIANAIWQFIDISSLQRLQSIAHQTDTATGRKIVASALLVTGIEAGLGWFLIIIVGLSLRMLGLTEPEQIADIASYVLKISDFGIILVPLLGFSVSVFMLSTISGFVSALAYVSFYDVVPGEKSKSTNGLPSNHLRRARFVTLLAVLFLYLGYVVLKRLLVSEDRISAALYAIYAFQIAITPSVISAMIVARAQRVPAFLKSGVSPAAVMLSTLTGIVAAWVAATKSELFAPLMDVDSLYVFPPLASFVVSVVVFLAASWKCSASSKR